METLLSTLNVIGPSFFSLLSVALLRKHTRWLCYITVLLSIWAELIPMTINVIGLFVCIACLVALVIADFVRTHYHVTRPFLHWRILGLKHLLR